MNARRCDENDYIEFLLAAQTAFGCVEAANSQPESLKSAAHDTYTRLLTRRPLDPEALWNEAQTVLGGVPKGGLLVLDDSTLDKPYARNIELVSRHWSGKHHRVVSGINLLSMVWTQVEGNGSNGCNGSNGSNSSNGSNGSNSKLPLPPVVPIDFRSSLKSRNEGQLVKNWLV